LGFQPPPDITPSLPLSGATPEQEDKKKNWNRNPKQPQQDVTSRAGLPDFFPQVHVVLPPEPESDGAQLVIVSEDAACSCLFRSGRQSTRTLTLQTARFAESHRQSYSRA